MTSRFPGWMVTLGCILLLSTCTIQSQEGNNSSRFGLDYVFPTDPQYQNMPLARIYSEAGLKWVNFADVKWQYFEPNAPVDGKHKYQWEKLDRAVKHWQSYGFDITMTLRLGKSWFSGPKKIEVDFPPVLRAMANFADRLPNQANYDDYQKWLKTLVERYDGDGVRDMPGLLRPVLYYQIGNEYGNPVFFAGTVEDYFVLLDMAARSIRSASNQAKVIPNGLRTNDLFHDDPQALNKQETLNTFYSRLDDLHSTGWKRGMKLDKEIIERQGQFDLIDAGGNGSWHTASEGYFNYVKRLQKRSGNEVPIWDMEARNEPLLTPIETTHMHMELGIPKGKHILNLLKWKNSPNHKKALRWYREEQARITAKVFVTKFAVGYDKVFMGMPIDWDKGVSALTWPNPFMGFLDSEAKKWPAYYTLKFLITELDGFTRAEKVKAEKGVNMFRFSFSDKKDIWVIWNEDTNPRGLHDPLKARKTVLSGIKASRIVELKTNGANLRDIEFRNIAQGCQLNVSPTPMFIYQ